MMILETQKAHSIGTSGNIAGIITYSKFLRHLIAISIFAICAVIQLYTHNVQPVKKLVIALSAENTLAKVNKILLEPNVYEKSFNSDYVGSSP